MKKIIVFSVLSAITFGLLANVILSAKKNPLQDKMLKSPASNTVVVMELFTSQGCSSCPPADALLGKYAAGNNENIIPLSFHVDYWNRLGWADPFSDAAFSNRQRVYETKIAGGSVYTPQLVINGEKEMVGSQRDAINAYVQKALAENRQVKISITALQKNNNNINVKYLVDGLPAGNVLNLALVRSQIQTNIKRGENSGLQLTNFNVVRVFKTVKPMASGIEAISIPANENVNENYFVALYTQDPATGKITGGAKKIFSN